MIIEILAILLSLFRDYWLDMPVGDHFLLALGLLALFAVFFNLEGDEQ